MYTVILLIIYFIIIKAKMLYLDKNDPKKMKTNNQ